MRDKDSCGTREAATIHEFERFSFRLDPLHLPRAPILRHNVSLCHGRATPLPCSPSPKGPCREACSSLSRRSIARVWNPRFWKLAAPNGTAECESRALRSSIGEGYGFSACIPLARPRGLIFPFSKSTSEMCRDASSDESWKYCRLCHAPRDTLPDPA